MAGRQVTVRRDVPEVSSPSKKISDCPGGIVMWSIREDLVSAPASDAPLLRRTVWVSAFTVTDWSCLRLVVNCRVQPGPFTFGLLMGPVMVIVTSLVWSVPPPLSMIPARLPASVVDQGNFTGNIKPPARPGVRVSDTDLVLFS